MRLNLEPPNFQKDVRNRVYDSTISILDFDTGVLEDQNCLYQLLYKVWQNERLPWQHSGFCGDAAYTGPCRLQLVVCWRPIFRVFTMFSPFVRLAPARPGWGHSFHKDMIQEDHEAEIIYIYIIENDIWKSNKMGRYNLMTSTTPGQKFGLITLSRMIWCSSGLTRQSGKLWAALMSFERHHMSSLFLVCTRCM